MLDFFHGVCLVLVIVFLGTALLLLIVLRGSNTAEDKEVTMHALGELVKAILIGVAEIPGKFGVAIRDVFRAGASPQIPPAPEPEPQQPQEKPPTPESGQHPGGSCA